MNHQALMQRALAAFQANRLPEALHLYREAASSRPDDADAWFMLGAISGQTGDYHGAERCFRKTTGLAPASVDAWDNLGIALMFLGEHVQAEQCFRQALKLNPQHAPAFNNLGNLMRTTHRLPEAIRCFNGALHINPAYAEVHNNLGLALRESGEHEQAVRHFSMAIELRPGYADACHNLGDTLKLAGDFEGALTLYRKALDVNPNLPGTHASIAELYAELNYRDKALAHFESALRLAPGQANALLGIARIRAATGHVDDAFNLLSSSLGRFPDNPGIAADLASLNMLRRDYEGAMRCIEPFLVSHPENTGIALAYANLSRHNGHEAQAIEHLQTVLAGPGLSIYQQEPLEHALARLFEARGDYRQAFMHCNRANTIRPETSDLQRHLAEMESIRKAFSHEFIASAPRASVHSDRPVFIVGMPRSGTSLVEQILSSHPDIHGAGEITLLWEISRNLPTGSYPESVINLSQQQLNSCTQRYLEGIKALSATAARVTDKLPHNFLHIGLINLLFPAARIIHCARDARDTCISIFFHKFNLSHVYARSLGELGTYYRHYERLMQHWQEVSRVPIMEIRYENLVQDFDRTARSMLEFCGLPWHPACGEYYKSKRIINTPSSGQASRPIYSSSIGRWQHFEPYIRPLLEALREHGQEPD